MKPHPALLASLAIATMTLLAAQSWQTGGSAPSLIIRHAGRSEPVADYVREFPAAVFQIMAPLEAHHCSALEKAAAVLAGERVHLIVLSKEPPPCPALKGIGIASEPLPPSDKFTLAIIDTLAIIRLVNSSRFDAPSLERAAKLAADWAGGRQVFITQCGHCHGDDGDDTSYPAVKTLKGISKRMSGDQILDGGQQFGAVDMSAWPQSTKDALLLYIRGL